MKQKRIPKRDAPIVQLLAKCLLKMFFALRYGRNGTNKIYPFIFQSLLHTPRGLIIDVDKTTFTGVRYNTEVTIVQDNRIGKGGQTQRNTKFLRRLGLNIYYPMFNDRLLRIIRKLFNQIASEDLY